MTNCPDNPYIDTACKLRDAVARKEYASFLQILDKASLPTGTSLEVRECRHTTFGDESELYILHPDGRHDKDVFGTLRFEDSPMGAWQAFLIHQMWHYLPLWWHSNYARREYVYSKDDLKVVTMRRSIEDSFVRRHLNLLGCRATSQDLAPEVLVEDEKYLVSTCFWSDFGGLTREYARLALMDGRMEGFSIVEEKVLFAYDCGILF